MNDNRKGSALRFKFSAGKPAATQIDRRFLPLGLRLVAVGRGLGIVGAWLAGLVMRGILYQIPAFDPLTLGATGLLLGSVSVVACLLPTLRASRVDPMEALRCE